MQAIRAALLGLTAGATLALSTSIANADGMARGRVYSPPPEPAVYNWGGLYFGLHAGWAWTDIDATLVDSSFFGDPGDRVSTDLDGFLWGGQIGIQHQWGRWVLGVEASLSGTSDLEEDLRSPSFPADDTWKLDIEEVALITGRLGYAWGRTMAYVKGGYATADVGIKFDTTFDPDENRRRREWLDGWTVGAGIEHAWGDYVVFGLEYNYIDLDSATLTAISPDTLETTRVEVDVDAIHTVFARLSFKLSRPAPAAAPLK